MNLLTQLFSRAAALTVLALAAIGFLPAATHAETIQVTGGYMQWDLDRQVWGSLNFGKTTPGLFDPSQYQAGVYDPGMYLEEFFDQATALTVPGNQRSSYQVVPGFGEIPSTGLVFDVNGPTVANLPGNNSKPTQFSYDPANPSGTAQGAVGFGGLLRFRGAWAAPNYASSYLSWGEFTLEYNPAFAVKGASGWALWNHVSFRAHSYDLLNVVTTVGANSLTLTGDLRFSPGTAASFFSSADAVKDLGNVTIHLTSVPVPAAVWLLGSALAGLVGMARRRSAIVG